MAVASYLLGFKTHSSDPFTLRPAAAPSTLCRCRQTCCQRSLHPPVEDPLPHVGVLSHVVGRPVVLAPPVVGRPVKSFRRSRADRQTDIQSFLA